MKKTIVSVVGARPNFMKVAPLQRLFAENRDITHYLVHTGQHYDKEMSQVFFDQLGLSRPERSLGVGSGGHGEMTGKIMIAFEKACIELQPDLVIVVGDVNSTIAAALVARKLHIAVAHVEAGLRSFDETMPEELNRRLTDTLSNLLFVSEPSGVRNLEHEGIPSERVHLVGDIMLETLRMFLPMIEASNTPARFDLKADSYCLVTLHRPSNVDTTEALGSVISILENIPCPMIFPIHPRTVKKLSEFGFDERVQRLTRLRLTAPLPYIDFLSLAQSARMMLSDSGSVQGEASFFNTPCLVARENTERPFYLEEGTSALVGRDKALVERYTQEILDGSFKQSTPKVKEIGAGVAEKTVQAIEKFLL